MFGVARHAPRINRYAARAPFVDERRNPNNDNKFEIFDRSPNCLSKNRHAPVLHMARITKRNLNQTLLPKRECGNDYEKWTTSKEMFGMVPLDRVSIDLKKKAGRTIHGGFYRDDRTTDGSIDYMKATATKTEFASGKKRLHGGLKYDRSLPRDELLYVTTDAMANVSLENSKPQREAVVARKKKERLERAKQHTLGASKFASSNVNSLEFVGPPQANMTMN